MSADVVKRMSISCFSTVIETEREDDSWPSEAENVTLKIPSTIDAAALCKMADRGQITGGILDGPLALDNAINLAAARIKKIDSPVAGLADILVVPDIESGNMLAKQLEYLADALSAGVAAHALEEREVHPRRDA